MKSLVKIWVTNPERGEQLVYVTFCIDESDPQCPEEPSAIEGSELLPRYLSSEEAVKEWALAAFRIEKDEFIEVIFLE